jgi:carboxymethylenebutenolidase
MSDVQIKTKDGVANAQFFPAGKKPTGPPVIMYMDAFGIRPGMSGMAEKLAGFGYSVLLPNLYYRAGAQKPFDPGTAFNDPAERERLMGLMGALTNKALADDVSSFMDWLVKQPAVSGDKFGCVGYCMDGRCALVCAGTFGERMAATACFHGGRLATDQPDSPHLLASNMRGAVYIGVAGLDAHFSREEKERLESALKAAKVRYTLEVYPNVKHGFAVVDHPVYDPPAAELHWQRIVKLFGDNLQG